MRKLGLLLLGTALALTSLGSVPSLDIEYRASVATNEALTVTVLRAPATNAVPVRATLNLKDERGKTVVTFPGQSLGTNSCDRITFELPAAALPSNPVFYPQLIVTPEGGGKQVFAYGFCPIAVIASESATRETVRQSLEAVATMNTIAFSVAAARDKSELTLMVSVEARDNWKNIVIFDDNKPILRKVLSERTITFNHRPSSRHSVLRVCLEDASGNRWYGQAVALFPLDFSADF